MGKLGVGASAAVADVSAGLGQAGVADIGGTGCGGGGGDHGMGRFANKSKKMAKGTMKNSDHSHQMACQSSPWQCQDGYKSNFAMTVGPICINVLSARW